MADLLDYRERFPILAETTYLINHSLGAMPAAAEQRVLQYARDWKTRGIRAWGEGWWELPLTVGDQIARLIGAPPGTVSMHQNVTIAEAVVLSCFGFDGPRRRIVYEEGELPVGALPLPGTAGRRRVVAADVEGSWRRSTTGRCSCPPRTCSSRRARSRTSRRSSSERVSTERWSCSTRTSRSGPCRST